MDQERTRNPLSEEELGAQLARELAHVMDLSALPPLPDSLEPRKYDLSDFERWQEDD